MTDGKEFVRRLREKQDFEKNCFETKCCVVAGHLEHASKALRYIIHEQERHLGKHEVYNLHDFFHDEKNREYYTKRLAKFVEVLKRVNLDMPKTEAVVTPSQVLDISREGK